MAKRKKTAADRLVEETADREESGQEPKLVWLSPDVLDELPDNPNVMTQEEEEQLEASIRRFGWQQPIKVMDAGGGRWWLQDGAHRKKIANKLGMLSIPAYVVPTPGPVDLAGARAIRLALNRVRGHVDLGLAQAELQKLQADGWASTDFVAVGFSADEVEAMLQVVEMDPLEEARAEAPDAAGHVDEGARRYAIRLTFDDEATRDAVKTWLLKNDATMEAALIRLAAIPNEG